MKLKSVELSNISAVAFEKKSINPKNNYSTQRQVSPNTTFDFNRDEKSYAAHSTSASLIILVFLGLVCNVSP